MEKVKVLEKINKKKYDLADLKYIYQFFKKHHKKEDIDLFFLFTDNISLNLSTLDSIEIIDLVNLFLVADINEQQVAKLYNIKTYCSVIMNNKYDALDAAYGFKKVKNTTLIERYLNSNYLISILFEENLYQEALKEALTFINSNDFNELGDAQKIISFTNIFLIYAKLNNYDMYKQYEKMTLALLHGHFEKYRVIYEISKVSAEANLYTNNKFRIDFNGNIERYLEIIKNKDIDYLFIYDTFFTHIDIVNEMIHQKLYSQALETCNELLSRINSVTYRMHLYRAMKDIYEITKSDKLFEIQKLYINAFETVLKNESKFYKTYIMHAMNLYEISNNYYDLLNNYEHDTLTNCYSRNAFMELVNTETKIEGSLIYIDLNNFKDVNDLHGHIEGDKYLQTFGQTLNDVFEGFGEPYRVGGDEFVVIIHLTDKDKIIELLTELRQNSNEKLGFDENYNLFASGIAMIEDNVEFNDIINKADKAMYNCKKNSNIFYYFDGE